MDYYSAIKKNEIWPFAATWMDLEGTVLGEISQTEKGKYCMISHMWNLKKHLKLVNKAKKEADTDTENKLVGTSEEKEVGRGNIGVGD